ncbi:MAG: hypothetical protein OQK75_10575 [Gammaproteobacteria bacterium]|nr:hypothetical protein [Gammaproteobacteria bacterium]MCW8988094.1 hypothetical protein [Gammaproteobacteria bacterium]
MSVVPPTPFKTKTTILHFNQNAADLLNLEQHYPALLSEQNPYLALLKEVISRTARLIAQW